MPDDLALRGDPRALSRAAEDRADAAAGQRRTPGKTEFGRFVIVTRLGAGAMGEVWSADDPQLGRRVALKLIHEAGGTRRAQRLLREAQALARLSHPNVVQVFEAGASHGEVYIAMEQVEGPTLRQWLAQSRRPWRERLAMCMQAGRGLAAAHAVGLVHRDFKPDNVLLGSETRDGELTWRARVADFGLARVDGDAPPAIDPVTRTSDGLLGTSLTETGSVLGTPAYMAPEQFLGEAVDARTDQFALCVVLFEALWGERPFTGATRLALGAAITEGRIRPIDEHGEVPMWIHAVILRGLAVDPAARHPSVDALLDALDRDPARRRRRVVGSVAVAGAVAGLAWSVGSRPEADLCAQSTTRLDDLWNPQRRAELSEHLADVSPSGVAPRGAIDAIDAYARAWTRGHHEACVATHVAGEQSPATLDLRMACLAEGRRALGATLAALDDADIRALPRIDATVAALPSVSRCADTSLLGERPAAPPELRSEIETIEEGLARARAAIALGRVAEGRALATELAQRAAALAHGPTLALALDERGKAELADGARTGARATLEEALNAALAEGNDDLAVRAALSLVDVVGHQLADDAQAQRWLQLAAALVERPGVSPERATEVLMDEGVIHFIHARYDEANAAYRAALARLDAAEAEGQPGPRDALLRGNLLSNLGAVALARGELGPAQAVFTERLVDDVTRLGDDHLEVATDLNNLGVVAFRIGDPGAARVYFEKAVEIRQRWLGEDHPLVTSTVGNLAGAYLQSGDLERAATMLRQQVAAPTGEDDERRAEHDNANYNLGIVLRELGRFEEAAAATKEAMEGQRRMLGSQHPATLASSVTFAEIELLLDRPAVALASIEPELAALDRIDASPYLRARTRFAAARAIVDTHGDARRAIALATVARDEADDPELAAKIVEWLAQRPSAPP